MAQPTVTAEFGLGGALVAVWGVDLVNGVFSLLTAPYESLFLSGPMLEYSEYVNFWVAVRCVLAVIGVAAGLLIMGRRRVGHWLSIASGVFLVSFGTDLHWYLHLLPPPFSTGPQLTSFYLRHPGLGYAVIVFPVVVACLAISSTVILYRRRRNGSVFAGAI
jgi:hypothetical protein